jgi:hypothetical protein
MRKAILGGTIREPFVLNFTYMAACQYHISCYRLKSPVMRQKDSIDYLQIKHLYEM